MEKSYSGRYPTRKEKQHRDITKALISMLSCRRYLASQGCNESFNTKTWPLNNQVNNISGRIVFPDGSEVGSNAFIKMQNSFERDALLERMIEKEIIFKRNSIDEYQRDNVVRTSFSNNGYYFNLSIIDTTKEGIIFPISRFMFSPRKFSFQYNMLLRKGVITDQHLEEFTKYQQGLEDVMRQGSLLTYSPQVPQRKRSEPQEVDVPKAETNFINPWEIHIPKLGKNE